MLSSKFAVILLISIVGVSFTQQWEVKHEYDHATPLPYNKRRENPRTIQATSTSQYNRNYSYNNTSTTEELHYERTDQKKINVSNSDTWLPGTYELDDETVLKLNPTETGENQKSATDFQVIENMLYGIESDNMRQISALEGKIAKLESEADRTVTDLDEIKVRINEINTLHEEVLKKLERNRL